MKKLNHKFIKGENWALAELLLLLGFVSCDEELQGSTESDSTKIPFLRSD